MLSYLADISVNKSFWLGLEDYEKDFNNKSQNSNIYFTFPDSFGNIGI